MPALLWQFLQLQTVWTTQKMISCAHSNTGNPKDFFRWNVMQRDMSVNWNWSRFPRSKHRYRSLRPKSLPHRSSLSSLLLPKLWQLLFPARRRTQMPQRRKAAKSLLFIAEQYLGKTLTKTDMDAITYFMIISACRLTWSNIWSNPAWKTATKVFIIFRRSLYPGQTAGSLPKSRQNSNPAVITKTATLFWMLSESKSGTCRIWGFVYPEMDRYLWIYSGHHRRSLQQNNFCNSSAKLWICRHDPDQMAQQPCTSFERYFGVGWCIPETKSRFGCLSSKGKTCLQKSEQFRTPFIWHGFSGGATIKQQLEGEHCRGTKNSQYQANYA